MGGYENRHLTLDWIHNFNNVSFDDALAFALSEEDWGGIEVDIVYEDDEDCVDCAELDEFLDSLQKKCDEAV